jgi:hypothetical protein
MANHLLLVKITISAAVFLTSVKFAEDSHPSLYMSNNSFKTITCDPQLEEDCESELLETIAEKFKWHQQLKLICTLILKPHNCT